MSEAAAGRHAQVAVDTRRCQAFGICVTLAPDVFDVPSGSASVVLLRSAIDESDLADIRDAVRQCPAQAISLVKDGA